MKKFIRIFLLLMIGVCGRAIALNEQLGPAVAKDEKEHVKQLLSKMSDIVTSLGLEVEIVNGDNNKTSWFIRPAHVLPHKKERSKKLTDDLSNAAAYITVLFFICFFIEAPTGFWDLFKKSFWVLITTAIAGGMVSFVYTPFAALLVDVFYAITDEDNCDNNKVKTILSDFLKDWPNNKQHMPEPLHEMFDKLHEKCIKKGKMFALTAQETQDIAATIFSVIMLDQKTVDIGIAAV